MTKTSRRARRDAGPGARPRLRIALLAFLATGIAFGAACAREEPGEEPVTPPRAAAEPPPAPVEESLPAVPVQPAPESAAPAAPSRSADAPAVCDAGAGAGETAASAASEEHVPLESLLRAPYAPGPPPEPPLDLGSLRYEPAAPESASPSAIDRLKDRVRLQRRIDAIGPAGPRQGTVSETDAGLSVPLDDSVSLEGGIRVDQRDEPGAEEPERKSTPRVGVKVRF
jgi:hypothetical protein